MIRLLNSRLANGVHATVDLFADTKEEVTDNATIVGMETTTIMDAGSTVLTAYGDYALRNSSGQWIWQDEEETTVQTSVTPSVQTLNLGRNILNSVDAEEMSEPDEPYEEPEELTER